MFEFLGANWGNLASVAGLVFSILAFVFSKRATQAAKEARAAILRRRLGEDLSQANRTAAEIVTYVGIGRGDMALLRVGELLNQASFSVARWQGELPKSSMNNLLTARAQLQTIHDVLTKSTLADLGPRAKATLAQTCQRVNAIFSEEYGAATRRGDSDG
jgi:hypothetical protein